MKSRSHALVLGLVLLGAALVAGFVGVLEKRFVEGKVYPHYASYRSDPLGASALYESLERLEGFVVSRNVQHLNTVKGLDDDTALLLIGYPREEFDDLRAPDTSPVMQAVKEGARLVITINPGSVPEKFRPERSELEEDWLERRRRLREVRSRQGKNAEDKDTERKDDEKSDAKKEEEIEKELAELEEELAGIIGPRLGSALGFAVTAPGYDERPEDGWETRPGEGHSAAPPAALPAWRSQYRFDPKDPAWKAAVLVGDDPVVIERPWGKGSVVVASDSYFASNESLHLDASPEFLYWLLGKKSKVVFDETIHGTVETGGAVKLIRRYRAHGIFIGLGLFLALWVWRCASPLVPGSEAQDRGLVDGGSSVLGEASGAGFLRLLRRSVAPSELLDQCLASWRSAGGTAGASEAVERDIAAVAQRHRNAPRDYGVAEAYRAIAERLRKR